MHHRRVPSVVVYGLHFGEDKGWKNCQHSKFSVFRILHNKKKKKKNKENMFKFQFFIYFEKHEECRKTLNSKNKNDFR